MGAQLGVPYGHMGCRQFGVQFGYLDVYDLPFCVPYDVVLLLNVPVVLFCVPYDAVSLLDVPNLTHKPHFLVLAQSRGQFWRWTMEASTSTYTYILVKQ